MSTSRFEFVLANGSDTERQAESRLLALAGRFDLDRFCFSPTVLLDSAAEQSGAFPVPVLALDRLSLDGDELLTALLHGQMHWALNQIEGGHDAVEEVKQRWLEDRDAGLDPPHTDALGQPCASGDYILHVAVMAMEFAALSDLLGPERAAQVMTGLPGYGWIRDQLSDGTAGLEGFIARHGLGSTAVPVAAPQPGTVVTIEPGGPRATLVTGDATEVALAERLSSLHGRFDLSPWRYSEHVLLDASGPPSPDGAAPSLSPFFLRFPEDDQLLNYLQLQAMWQAGRLDPEALEGTLQPVLRSRELEAIAAPVHIVVGCAIALHALVSLVGDDAAEAATARHPRNSQLYSTVTPHLSAIREAIRASGIDSGLVHP